MTYHKVRRESKPVADTIRTAAPVRERLYARDVGTRGGFSRALGTEQQGFVAAAGKEGIATCISRKVYLARNLISWPRSGRIRYDGTPEERGVEPCSRVVPRTRDDEPGPRLVADLSEGHEAVRRRGQPILYQR